jgi:stage V sporulation protein R
VASVGTGTLPVIEITDADFQGSRHLYLVHRYQGQELELPHARATMELLRTLWGRDVFLNTVLNDKPAQLHCSEDGFSAEST